MGQQIECTVRLGERGSAGTAHLETDGVRFRGEFKLTIPFREVTSVEAADGTLSVAWTQGVAHFDIGPRAAAWAEAIRNPRRLIDKLGVKPDMRVALLGVGDDDFRAQLRERTREIVEALDDEPRADCDVILLGADEQSALERIAGLVPHLRRNGGLWVVAPKGRRHITEMDVLLAGRAAGLKDNKVARFSASHTAHRFVIPVDRR